MVVMESNEGKGIGIVLTPEQQLQLDNLHVWADESKQAAKDAKASEVACEDYSDSAATEATEARNSASAAYSDATEARNSATLATTESSKARNAALAAEDAAKRAEDLSREFSDGLVSFKHGDTQYQTDVDIPTVTAPDDSVIELVTGTELAKHADHDAEMYTRLTNNIKISIEASLTNYFTKSQANAATQAAISAALQNYLTSSEVNNLIAEAVSSGMTEDQVNSIVSQALQAAGANVVTQQQMTDALHSMALAIESGKVVEQADSGVDPNGQYYLEGTKYSDGQLIITGWVAKVGDRFSAYFPGGLQFINTNYAITQACADDESDLDNNENNTLKFGTPRTDSFTCLASKFGVAILGGGAVGDGYRYSVGFIGRWK